MSQHRWRRSQKLGAGRVNSIETFGQAMAKG